MLYLHTYIDVASVKTKTHARRTQMQNLHARKTNAHAKRTNTQNEHARKTYAHAKRTRTQDKIRISSLSRKIRPFAVFLVHRRIIIYQTNELFSAKFVLTEWLLTPLQFCIIRPLRHFTQFVVFANWYFLRTFFSWIRTSFTSLQIQTLPQQNLKKYKTIFSSFRYIHITITENLYIVVITAHMYNCLMTILWLIYIICVRLYVM